MKRPKVSVTPRISAETAERLNRLHPSLHTAAVYHLEAQPHLHDETLAEIWGQFSKEEALIFIGAMKAFGLVPQSAGRLLQDAVTVLGRQKRIKMGPILEKIRKLHRYQVASIELWAKEDFETLDGDLDDHLAWLVRGISELHDAEHYVSAEHQSIQNG